jgi:hypothetical protein
MMLLLLLLPARAVAERLTVITPPPASFFESPFVSVVVQVGAPDVESVEITMGNQRKAFAPGTVAMGFHHFAGVDLAPGVNTMRVAGYSGGRLLEQKEFQVFFRSERSPDRSLPAGFTRNFFHSSTHEQSCRKCHRMAFEGIAQTPENPEKSPCYCCHARVTGWRYVHGPAAVWSCSVCHNTTARGQKVGVIKPDAKACAVCHDSSVGACREMPGSHGPTGTVNCVICHNPHGSDRPFFL